MVRPLRLASDIYDLEGKLVAGLGQELSPDFMRGVAEAGLGARTLVPLGERETMLADLRGFISEKPYDLIFAQTARMEKVTHLFADVKMHPAVFEIIEKFKEGDFYTYRHCMTVGALATLISFDIPSIYQQPRIAVTVAPSHDVGKIGVPLEILRKTEPLTREELAVIRGHATAGFVLLTYYMGFENPLSCQVAFEHHETCSGTGYPRGITLSDEIVELVAACDTFDALISPRPYRANSYDHRSALEALCDAAEKGALRWTPVKLLIAYSRATKPRLEHVVVSRERRGRPPQGNRYGVIAK